MNKEKILVIGLESSCTKYVAKMMAVGLYIIPTLDDWDGNDFVENEYFLVMHRSLPHGKRDNFISVEFADCFDRIVISTRDYYASLISKNNVHQPEITKARSEHRMGAERLAEIYGRLHEKSTVFSYESAYILGPRYVDDVLLKSGADLFYVTERFNINNINEKHMKEVG
jgi:hypothetical protein